MSANVEQRSIAEHSSPIRRANEEASSEPSRGDFRDHDSEINQKERTRNPERNQKEKTHNPERNQKEKTHNPKINQKERTQNPERNQEERTRQEAEDAYASRSPSPANSVFKRAFKQYKKRSPPPDLSAVIDFRAESLNPVITRLDLNGEKEQTIPLEETREVGLKPKSEWKAFGVANKEGLFVLSDIFDHNWHLPWMEKCLRQYPEAPNKTNVHLHVPDATELFVNHTNKLRWATLGYHYDWTTKVYPSSGDPLPSELVKVADVISRAIGLGSMQADATIINYYPPKSTLSPHVDRSERFLERPLISLSFGQSAVYLSGGTDLDDNVDAFYLHSGDVLVMHDTQRLVYHAVPSIQKTKTFDYDSKVSEDVVNYANKNRINVTIRQVDRH